MIKYPATLNRTSIPTEFREYLDKWNHSSGCYGNDSFFYVDVSEFRDYVKNGTIAGYIEDYGQDMASFMQWLETQTSRDEILILYSW